MAKNAWNTITDILTDVVDIFGLGDAVDKLAHPELYLNDKYKEPTQVYQEILSKVNDQIDNIQNLNNSQITKLTNALNAMYSQAPSISFKSQINKIKNNMNNMINDLNNKNSNLEMARQNAANNANRVLAERGSGATYLQDDIEKQNQAMVDKIQTVENKV